jgi:hypothetical protein
MENRVKILDQMILNQVAILEEQNKKLSYNPIESEPVLDKSLCEKFTYICQDAPIFATTKCQAIYPMVLDSEDSKKHYEYITNMKFENLERTSNLDIRQIKNLFEAYNHTINKIFKENATTTWQAFEAQGQEKINADFTKQYQNLYNNYLNEAKKYNIMLKNVNTVFIENMENIVDFIEDKEYVSDLMNSFNNGLKLIENFNKELKAKISSPSEFSQEFEIVINQYTKEESELKKNHNALKILNTLSSEQLKEYEELTINQIFENLEKIKVSDAINKIRNDMSKSENNPQNLKNR